MRNFLEFVDFIDTISDIRTLTDEAIKLYHAKPISIYIKSAILEVLYNVNKSLDKIKEEGTFESFSKHMPDIQYRLSILKDSWFFNNDDKDMDEYITKIFGLLQTLNTQGSQDHRIDAAGNIVTFPDDYYS